MNVIPLIEKKKLGRKLTQEEIAFFVNGAANGSLPDYQLAALLMAIRLNGMDREETAQLTLAMARSGDMVDLSMLDGIPTDKHSTGGVGDTTTLVLAPLVAACGVPVAKMSGRGLGHTGGTLDKLESVPGVRVEQPIEAFKEIVKDIGLCVIGQTGNLVPADKKIYALRDVTGTVQSIPLIASSIMSKKLASGADAIVLDVKFGTGAFMQTPQDAQRLAKTMVRIGNRLQRRTMAVITDMNQPLGMAVGNGLEVKEAIDVLSGRVPDTDPLYRVCMILGACMLQISGFAKDEAEAQTKLHAALQSGAGLKKLERMLTALGALDAPGVIADPARLCGAKKKMPVALGKKGYIGDMRASAIGVAAQMLGAGRATKADAIDPAVGILLHKRRGDAIEAEEPFATFYVNEESRLEDAQEALLEAVQVVDAPPQPAPIVYEIVRE